MASYLHPGVYVEEIPSGAKPIEGIGTSVAAFVGYAAKGPMKEPQLIFRWDDYQDRYGGIRDTGKARQGDPMGFSVLSFFQNGGTKAYVVRLAAGASQAEGYLLHPDQPPDQPEEQILKFTARNEGTWGNHLRVWLRPKDPDNQLLGLFTLEAGLVAGTEEEKYTKLERFTDLGMDPHSPDYIESKVNDASSLVYVQVQDVAQHWLGTSTSSGSLASVDVMKLNGRKMTVTLDGDASTVRTVEFATDRFSAGDKLSTVAGLIEDTVRGIVTSDANPRKNFSCKLVDDRLVLTSGSRLPKSAVVVTGPEDNTDATELLLLGVKNEGVERTGAQALSALLSQTKEQVDLDGGKDGDEPERKDYQEVLSAFLKNRDINIICLPGQHWSEDGTGNAVISDAISHAEAMKNRMVIVDASPGKELKEEADVTGLSLPTSSYTVLYHPWVRVTNPFYNAEKNPGTPRTLLIPPCGFAAGIWAKTDGQRGVWKAPAGVETSMLGLAGLEHTVEDGEQDQLNPLGINCLRKLPGYGAVIWGARTLSTKADPEWRYVSVRRTAIMIEQSVYDGIQWAVFEPNDDRLWSTLRLNIESFMNGLFRAGAFQGQKASDAYFVRCGLGDTMTQGDIDRGQVIVVVGFAPLKPAEFVIVRIQQKVGQQ